MLGKRVHQGPGHHEMIEHADIDQGQRLAQRVGEAQVGLARLRRAGRVVVRQQDVGGIASQCFLDHFARVYAGVG